MHIDTWKIIINVSQIYLKALYKGGFCDNLGTLTHCWQSYKRFFQRFRWRLTSASLWWWWRVIALRWLGWFPHRRVHITPCMTFLPRLLKVWLFMVVFSLALSLDIVMLLRISLLRLLLVYRLVFIFCLLPLGIVTVCWVWISATGPCRLLTRVASRSFVYGALYL